MLRFSAGVISTVTVSFFGDYAIVPPHDNSPGGVRHLAFERGHCVEKVSV